MFLSLIVLISVLFYLNRSWIMERAVDYLNRSQPGEVRMDHINLIPFMGFPDVALQLKNVSFYESSVSENALYMEPILSLNEIYVSLDVVDLIRGDLIISRARLKDGNIRIVMYEDSVTNLEHALGIRFGEDDEREEEQELPSINVDLKKLQLSNIQLVMHDRVREDHFHLMVNSLENRFSYLPELIETGVELDIDINSFNYQTIKLEEQRNIQLESNLSFDRITNKLTIHPSALSLSGLLLEVWGSSELLEEITLDLGFRATNTGLDVLNYLLKGILNMDEIEQIGSGNIRLDGEIRGKLGRQLPVITVNGVCDGIGFRIKPIGKDVTGISFRAFASNGKKSDLSQAVLKVEEFRANFPEGNIKGRFTVRNMIAPEVDIEASSDLELAGLEAMIASDVLKDLKGHVKLDGKIRGVMDREKDDFIGEGGDITAVLRRVGFVMKQDTVEKINGEIFVQENTIGTRGLDLDFNGNHMRLGARADDLLLYLLGSARDVKAELALASDRLSTAKLFRDSSLVNLLGEEIEGLHFTAGARISKKELDAFIKKDSLPEMLLTLDSFGVRLPVYADISNLNASLKLGRDTLDLYHLNGMIGESGFRFSGRVINYAALMNEDSGEVVNLEYHLASDRMRAEDLFTLREGFLLPETYRTEYLENFRLSGSFEAPVSGLVTEGSPLDLTLHVSDLGWNFRYYPLAFDQFLIRMRKEGDQLFVDDFRGKVGESNLKMKASIGNITDSLENMEGNLVLESDLLDFNELLNYQNPDQLKDSARADSANTGNPPRLDQIDYPRFSFSVDIGELRYGTNSIFGMKGSFRSSKEKILYLDHLVTSGQSGGTIAFNGQFNVSNPGAYTFITEVEIEQVNVNDLSFEMTSGEESYTLKENFAGLVSTKGMAEIFITPDLTFDISTSTATFDVTVTDGELINFTPLQAAAKYLDNKDLNHVRFARLRNRFTLVDSRIIIPLMSVGSTAGQLLIEGEQGLDNSYLYLLRIPTWLVKDAAISVLSGSENEQQEEQMYEMKMGKFLVMTLWSDGEVSEVKTGDKRDRYQP